jgi:predicted PurR-regulated permease PerM
MYINRNFRLSANTIQNFVFALMLIGLCILVCRIFAPFVSVFLWSILLFIIFDPLYKKVVHNIEFITWKGRLLRVVFAGIFTFAVMLLTIMPLGIILFQLYMQLFDVFHLIKDHLAYYELNKEQNFIFILSKTIADFINSITGESIRIDTGEVTDKIMEIVDQGAHIVVSYTGKILQDIGKFIVSLALVAFCLFFCFLDGAYLNLLVKKILPIKKTHITTLFHKFKEITRALILGYLTVALIQSVIAFIVFLLFNVKNALLFACLTFISVFIPIIGGAIVWIPLGIIKIAAGSVVSGIVFMVVSCFCVSVLDHILRPCFLQNRLQLHPLIIFFSILGGLILFNVNGLILGPVTIVLFFTVLELFFKEHHITIDQNRF